MATTSKAPQSAIVKVVINIGSAVPDPFEVSKGQKDQVQWICGQNHEHDHQKGCFRIYFDGDCPFDKKEAHFHGELSGPPNAASVPEKKYKYTVDIPGHPPNDPIGIVKQ